MIAYIFTGFLFIVLLLIFILVNRRDLSIRLFMKIPRADGRRNRVRLYLEKFRENKQSNISKGMFVQLLPWLGVLALVFILGNHYLLLASVLSGSMEPTFKRGDLVLMQTLDLKANVGDIIMFPLYGFKEPITHRVVGLTPKGDIITKGDANARADVQDGFPPDRVAGKAVMINGNPIVLKGWGYYIRPEQLGDPQVLTKLPPLFIAARVFEQFQSLQPLIIFFATIFYFFILLENRMESRQRYNRKNGTKTTRSK